MALAILSLIGLAAFVLYNLFTCYRNYHRCPDFDGPFLAKISGAWLFFHTLSGELNETNAALLRKYGKHTTRSSKPHHPNELDYQALLCASLQIRWSPMTLLCFGT